MTGEDVSFRKRELQHVVDKITKVKLVKLWYNTPGRGGVRGPAPAIISAQADLPIGPNFSLVMYDY